LFTHFLHPILLKTARSSPTGSVRVCWAGSLTIDLDTPEGGIDIDDLHYTKSQSQATKYAQSKCGNLFLASEFAKRTPDESIISVAFNPGISKRHSFATCLLGEFFSYYAPLATS